ncbi:MAG: M17 family metallopeptidase, partial [Nitrospinota bacterium]
MKIEVISGDIVKLQVNAVMVNLFEGLSQPGGATAAVDRALEGAITRLIAEGEIKGKLGEVTVIHSLGRIPSARVAVLGLGKQEDFTLDRIRGVVAGGCRALRKIGARRVATILHGAGAAGFESADAAQAVTEGALLGLYTFKKHITKEPEEGDIEELLIVEREENRLPPLREAVERGAVIAEAANLARDLVNEPANRMTPTALAEAARQVAEEEGLELSVLERGDMEEMGMGALLGVAQGSRQPPKFIVLRYLGAGPDSPALGLIGKGLTFDSGGLSIKPSEGMGEMKSDMAGGAAVIAALKAIARLKPKINVTGLVPATENLPDGAALKPGDILRTMGGKTIEVVTTDAEGRLLLADSLCYARQQGLSPLVDIATLTGSCKVALGDVCTGIFGNDQEVVDKVIQAAERAGEKLWQLPLYEEYKEQNK